MDIVLHLGAHKTASTYLQSLLEKNVVALEHHQVGFATPKTLRPMIGIAPRRRFSMSRSRHNDARTWALQRVIDTAHDLQRKRLIISEEQLIGSLRPLFSGKGLYRDVSNELRGVTAALQGTPVKVMMAIRSYDTFLTSAYGQVLTGWKYIGFSQELREHLIKENRGWPEIVTEIMQALPKGSSLTLWQYEGFRHDQRAVLRNLVGCSAEDELKPLNTTPRPGPSREGIAALDRIAKTGTPPDIETIRRTLRRFGKEKGFPGYSPWKPLEQEAFEERYAKDLGLIRCLWPEAMLTETVVAGVRNSADARFNPQVKGTAGFPITNLQRQTSYRRPTAHQY